MDDIMPAPSDVQFSGNWLAENAESVTISFGNFRLDPARRLLLKNGEPVRIGSRALDLLIVLIDRAGDVVGRHELLDLVWQDVVVDEAGVRVHISSLRRTLADGQDGARYIVNIAGRGYSFVAPITRNAPGVPSQSDRVPLPARVPPSSRSIIGREHVVDSLSRLLLARRFISVVGAGGIGKTTVATAIVHGLRSEFGDENVVIVDLGSISDPDLVPGAVVSAVGCTIAGADPVAELLTFLVAKRVLIVLDSCEHLVEPASHLASQLFQGAPDIHLLITSRESLRVEGETVHLLSPLAYPTDEFPTAVEALATPAVQLFMDRAVFSGFHGALTDRDAPVVAEICRRTDGIALAIELAASRVGTYGIQGVANLLATNVELRLFGRRNVAPRHQTLEAMLDWSFKLLAEDEQRVLCRLSAFVGLFTMEAACFVADEGDQDVAEVAATTASLVEKSLVWVQSTGEAVFYRLPDTTRIYAAAKLAQAGEAESIAERHARYFANLFKTIAREDDGSAEIGPHASHIGNLRKALEWSFSNAERHAIGVELTADAAALFLGLSFFAECRHWSLMALGAIENISDASKWELCLQEALALSSIHTHGSSPEVRGALDRALNLARSEESELPQLRLIAGLEFFLTRLGDFEGALTAARIFAVIAGRVGSKREQVIAEWMLAATCQFAADQAAAANHYERGFCLAAEVGDVDFDFFGYNHHLRAMIGRARSFWNRGSPQSACKFAREAIEEGARRHPPTNYCMAVVYSVPVLLWSGEADDSYEHIERVLSHAERYSLAPVAGVALALKGEWLLMKGNPSAGADNLRQALNVLQSNEHRIVTAAASRALADCLARCGRHHEAYATIDAAISSTREMGQKVWLPELHRTRGEIILMAPCPDAKSAERAFRRSIELAGEQAALGWQLKAAVSLARLLRLQNRSAEVRMLLEPIVEAHVEKSGSSDLTHAANLLAWRNLQ